MSDSTPRIVPLGSLADAAAAGAQIAQQEQQLYASSPDDIGTTTGIWVANP
jgi:hypothetical protein